MDWGEILSAIPILLYVVLMVAIPVTFVVALIELIVRASNHLKARAKAPEGHPPEGLTAREILDQRYARGEVSREEYEQVRQAIET